MEPIKTAIIGCGRNAWQLHTPILEKHPDFQVVGTYDIIPEAAQKLAAHFGCKAYESREALLASDVEYVVILTDSHVHTEVAAACLRAGKDVLLTKPWALDTADADFIISVAKESGKHLMPFLPQNWGSDMHTIKALSESGDIGKVYMIRRRAATFGKRYDWQIWKKFGGGYLNNWGPHLIGQLLELVDEPIATVHAETKQVIMDGDCEDMFFAVLKTASGVLINVEFAIMVDKLPHWIVEGSKGSVFITDGDIEIHRISYPGPVDPTAYRSKTQDDVEAHPLEGQYNGDRYAIYTHIADVIRGNCAYKISLEFARYLTVIMDAIHKSAETGSVVKLFD